MLSYDSHPIPPLPDEAEVHPKGISGSIFRNREKKISKLNEKLEKLKIDEEFYHSIGEVALGKLLEIEGSHSTVPKVDTSDLETGRPLTGDELLRKGESKLTKQEKDALEAETRKVIDATYKKKHKKPSDEELIKKEAEVRGLYNEMLKHKSLENLTPAQLKRYKRWELLSKNPNELTAEEIRFLESGSEYLSDPDARMPKRTSKYELTGYKHAVTKKQRQHEKQVVENIRVAGQTKERQEDIEKIRKNLNMLAAKRGGERIFITPKVRRKERKRLISEYEAGHLTRNQLDQELEELKHSEFMLNGESTARSTDYEQATKDKYHDSMHQARQIVKKPLAKLQTKQEEINNKITHLQDKNEKAPEKAAKRKASVEKAKAVANKTVVTTGRGAVIAAVGSYRTLERGAKAVKRRVRVASANHAIRKYERVQKRAAKKTAHESADNSTPENSEE